MPFLAPDPKKVVLETAGNPAESIRQRDLERAQRESRERDEVRARADVVVRVQRGPGRRR